MRVFSVPVSVPFLRTVVSALLDGRLVEGFEARKQPARLADATLYLPTRRAMRVVREIFLDEMTADAAVLPRIVALGDIDEDELAFADEAEQFSAAAPLDIPPRLGELERRLTLARLVAAWAKGPVLAPLVVGGPASTLALAGDLARLIDDMVTRGVDWSALDGLVPDQLDQYWQHSLEFLRIARIAWPSHLAEINRIEPAARRDLLIAAEAKRLTAHPRGPVIAAGSTGSMPATAKFLHAVASLPHGAVVLPGLDTDLDEDAWRTIGGVRDALGKFAEHPASNHPQYAMHALLQRFGIKRSDVDILRPAAEGGRDLLASESMRPSAKTEIWHDRLKQPDVAAKIAAGMTNVAVVEAPNPEMEALAIAIAMREARHLGKSAALVTPDRALARRVMAALTRWDLAFDDSGGDVLMETSAGIFARLAAEATTKGLEPPTLLALLKHPLCRLGRAPGQWKAAIEGLELAALRGTRPPAGTAGLTREFNRFREELAKLWQSEVSSLHPAELRARLKAEDLDRIQALIAALQTALAPIESLVPARPYDFAELAHRHREILIGLSRDEQGIPLAFEERDGFALAAAFDDLLRGGTTSGLMVPMPDYADVFQTAFGDRAVRRPDKPGARLQIYGPLESRLMQADRVIIGGLIEGVWPPAPRIDPWLSRPMRHELGLDLPERRIGLSAHDFAQLLGADEVILTHSAKTGGAPAVASRFLHRLEAVAGDAHWKVAKRAGEKYVQFAGALDQPEMVKPIKQPEPRPPRAARPLKLSVTAIEDWLRDPYTIYARHILRLDALDPVDMPLSAADRGSAIHDALGEFTETYAAHLPDDPARVLHAIGEKHFAPLMERPEARALWWPRFQRIARWFGEWETARRNVIEAITAETHGEISILLDNERSFRLSARADRIERRQGGSYAILDYKTGQPPTAKQVRMGLSPQLTLEAAILREGGFPDIDAGASVSQLVYVRLSGNNPPGEERILELKIKQSDTPQPPDTAAAEARVKLEALIRAFEDENQPYTSLNLPMWTNRYGAYDDLARIKEWSAAGGLGIEEW
ncbi:MULTISPECIES: double-strand break repair protein AddB [unclassified Bradyrhizobium]|uniref:double-strand break repair protein AddB n=1 Tax=unclassified Bradyrhizobium TaxID=2631580 RepID=UPI0024799DA2|nr:MULTISPECIES: double-strand break repair protein AddB [unclassified Bradyrhizobium]WGR71458.1 double-strand break repair protein AddB [Bradyrhizobium sp. ISRA426]WGR76293.1 double-strand break repair protein AddB [Bradyrhizobium sp. ISRA430]WGR86698.1 double-strand break repair protein AddB [Bradyrhizobium sp. ISRA432]